MKREKREKKKGSSVICKITGFLTLQPANNKTSHFSFLTSNLYGGCYENL
jgi:hypothetical protein